MDFKKLSKVFDSSLKRVKDSESVPKGWEVVYAGIDETPCGIVNAEHTIFKPYVGHWEDGYAFEDEFGVYPYDDDVSPNIVKKGIKAFAKRWGVNPKDIKVDSNDSFEGGYLYAEGKELGPEVKIDPEMVTHDDPEMGHTEELYFKWDYDSNYDDSVEKVYNDLCRIKKDELEDGSSIYWWYPCVLNQ